MNQQLYWCLWDFATFIDQATVAEEWAAASKLYFVHTIYIDPTCQPVCRWSRGTNQEAFKDRTRNLYWSFSRKRYEHFQKFRKLGIPGPEPSILFGNMWEIYRKWVLHLGDHKAEKMRVIKMCPVRAHRSAQIFDQSTIERDQIMNCAYSVRKKSTLFYLFLVNYKNKLFPVSGAIWMRNVTGIAIMDQSLDTSWVMSPFCWLLIWNISRTFCSETSPILRIARLVIFYSLFFSSSTTPNGDTYIKYSYFEWWQIKNT